MEALTKTNTKTHKQKKSLVLVGIRLVVGAMMIVVVGWSLVRSLLPGIRLLKKRK